MPLSNWVLFALLASALGGFCVIIDKVLLTRYSRDYIYLTAFLGVINFFPILLVPFFISVATPLFVFAIIAGVFFRLAVFFYMKAITLEEASRVVPLWLTSPLFVLVLERIFLDENILAYQYAGIFAVITGSLIIMTTKVKGLLRLRPAFYIIMLSNIVFAVSEVLIKYLSIESEFLPLLFWLFAGSALASVPVLAFKYKKKHQLFYSRKRLLPLLLTGMMLFIVTIGIYWYAVKLGPVSLVSTLGGADGLFVFLYAIVFTKFAPSILKEAIDRKTLLTKATAIAIIIAGVFLINGGV